MDTRTHKELSTAGYDEADRSRLQVTKTKRRSDRLEAPAWAGSLSSIEQKLLTGARRRVNVAYLYFLVGLTCRDIAVELDITPRVVKLCLQRLRKIE